VRWLARAGTGAKVVVHLHGRIWESKGLEPIWFSGRGADAVVAVSRAVAERVVGARPYVVYSGMPVSAERGTPGHHEGTSKLRIIGTAGRLVPLKGIVYLLRAMAALRAEFPHFVLEIAGSGPERPRLERQVQAFGLAGRVRFLGWVNELAPVLARWSLFVLPSLEEGFGIGALEAMAAGLPVVATAVGGIPELVEDGRTGRLVPPGDAEVLAERIRLLLRNHEVQDAMGAAGRARAREYFSVERMAIAISQIYDHLLGAGAEG